MTCSSSVIIAMAACTLVLANAQDSSVPKAKRMLESTESRCDWLWCASRNVEWAIKCKRKRCDACEECSEIVFETETVTTKSSTSSSGTTTAATIPIETT